MRPTQPWEADISKWLRKIPSLIKPNGYFQQNQDLFYAKDDEMKCILSILAWQNLKTATVKLNLH